MINYTVTFIFCKELHRVLLIEKNKPEWQKGFYNGIGGKYEKDESYIDCTIREVKEECGLELNPLDIKLFAIMCTIPEWKVWCTTIELTREEYYKYEQKEEELIYDCKIEDIHCCSKKILGNVPWLVGLALDTLKNNPLTGPHIFNYKNNSLSLPLNL